MVKKGNESRKDRFSPFTLLVSLLLPLRPSLRFRPGALSLRAEAGLGLVSAFSHLLLFAVVAFEFLFPFRLRLRLRF